MGRDINLSGAHVRPREDVTPSWNSSSIGIAFAGGRVGSSARGGLVRSADTFTDAQWAAFDQYVTTFLRVFPGALTLGHGDVQPEDRTDPEFDVRALRGQQGQDLGDPEGGLGSSITFPVQGHVVSRAGRGVSRGHPVRPGHPEPRGPTASSRSAGGRVQDRSSICLHGRSCDHTEPEQLRADEASGTAVRSSVVDPGAIRRRSWETVSCLMPVGCRSLTFRV